MMDVRKIGKELKIQSWTMKAAIVREIWEEG